MLLKSYEKEYHIYDDSGGNGLLSVRMRKWLDVKPYDEMAEGDLLSNGKRVHQTSERNIYRDEP